MRFVRNLVCFGSIREAEVACGWKAQGYSGDGQFLLYVR